jgi:hypothetical protein
MLWGLMDYQQKYFEKNFSDLKDAIEKVSRKLDAVESSYATKELLKQQERRIDKIYNLG